MKNKIYVVFIFCPLFFLGGAFVFADQNTTPAPQDQAPPPLPANATAADVQSTYLYDLKKLIEKSRENIKEVNEKIKQEAVLKRNQAREERAREYYEKGVELTNEGKLDEAREYFEKAIRITEHPEMAGYIRESQRRLRREENELQAQEHQHNNQIKEDENTRKQEVEEAYKEAVELYKEKKYHPAKDAFDHVDDIAPDYRATDSYLKLIDQDIIVADAVAAKQQAAEIERQQKEAEAARAKEKEMWMQQIEEKEKERKDAIDKQAAQVYDQAVDLYNQKKFAEAKKKFQEVSWVIPDYKKTVWYLGRIDRDAEKEKEIVAQEQQKSLQEQQWEETVEQKKEEAAKAQELQAKQARQQKDLQDQAQFLYTAAVNLYNGGQLDEALQKFNDIEKLVPDFKDTRSYILRVQTPKAQQLYDQALDSYHAHQWAQARSQFEAVEQLVPNFKHTRRYLQKIDVIAPAAAETPAVVAAAPPAPVLVSVTAAQPSAPAVNVAASAAPAGVVPASPSPAVPAPVSSQPPLEPSPLSTAAPAPPVMTLEEQQRQTQDIETLLERSEQLYEEIAEIANDRLTAQTKRKMARLNQILSRLKKNQERILRQMQEQQWRQHQEEAEKMYQEALDAMHAQDYMKAKMKFMALENINPDYKATRRYLNEIDNDIKRANSLAVTSYEKAQAENLRQLQEKENAAQVKVSRQEQQKEQAIEAQQQEALKELVDKASDINDDIIRMALAGDYEGMKTKFSQLEDIVMALMALKAQMAKQEDDQERARQLEREAAHERQEMASQQQEAVQAHGMAEGVSSEAEHRPILSNQEAGPEYYKRREILQEQNTLFNEGVDEYEHRKYTEARLLFGELADQHDRRAEEWLKKVDHAIGRQLLNSQESEEREQTAFIEDQLKAQRELAAIQEREHQRQKKLTEELERQQRLYEDDRLLQLRKEELLKSQERERERQEAKRLRQEEENAKNAETLRFHRVEPAAAPAVPVPAAATASVAAAKPAASAPAVAATAAAPAMSPQQLKAQVAFSDARKAYLDRQYQKEQKEKAREERIKAAQEARAARIKAAQDAREKRIEEREKEKERRQELKEQEEKRREELRQQKQEALEEKANQQQAVHQESQDQAQLQVQRDSVRKQLEDGVESMYQDALGLYNQGNYAAAAQRFKDIQDIIPGYKRSAEYMDEARQKALAAPAAAAPAMAAPAAQDTTTVSATDNTTVTSTPPSSANASVSAPAPVSDQEDDVSKALDVFDPNAKS